MHLTATTLLTLTLTTLTLTNPLPLPIPDLIPTTPLSQQKSPLGFGDPASNPNVRGGIYFYRNTAGQTPNCTGGPEALWLRNMECYGPMTLDFSIQGLRTAEPHDCVAYIHTRGFCDPSQVQVLTPGTCYLGGLIAEKKYTVSVQCPGDQKKSATSLALTGGVAASVQVG